MRVTANDLARIVLEASRGALPEELLAARRAAAAILRAETTADLASDHSRFLARVIETGQPYLTHGVTEQLRGVHLYGIDSAYTNAIPDTSQAAPRIFVFQGLLQILYYIIHLIRVLERLQALRPVARFSLDGEDLPEALAFSMAGFSILSDALLEQRFPAVLLHDMLGPIARADALSAYRFAVLFVLLHELGHIESGHLQSSQVRSERPAMALAEPERLSVIQTQELTADAFALDRIKPAYRAELMPSLIFFFTPFTFLEAFSGALSKSHPLAVNRLSALAQRADMPPDAHPIVMSWIDGQLESLHRMAPSRDKAGGTLRMRIEERMPVRRAYEVVRIIQQQVLQQSGILDGRPSATASDAPTAAS